MSESTLVRRRRRHFQHGSLTVIVAAVSIAVHIKADYGALGVLYGQQVVVRRRKVRWRGDIHQYPVARHRLRHSQARCNDDRWGFLDKAQLLLKPPPLGSPPHLIEHGCNDRLQLVANRRMDGRGQRCDDKILHHRKDHFAIFKISGDREGPEQEFDIRILDETCLDRRQALGHVHPIGACHAQMPLKLLQGFVKDQDHRFRAISVDALHLLRGIRD
mmetsp:Transcript_36602/g.70959  ORF Transcript_36602/g.70959 Transcript_36602/m.70959 type:complete len:217 (-) Transcript_36602:222-872(-)